MSWEVNILGNIPETKQAKLGQPLDLREYFVARK